MKGVRHQLRGQIRDFIHRCGWQLVNAAGRWGVDPFCDLEKLAKGEDVREIFDVGANVGEASERFCLQFPNARIHAFEPGADAYQSLKGKLQRHPQVIPVNSALSDSIGNGTLYSVPGNSKVSSLERSARQLARSSNVSTITVSVNTVDSFCQSQGISQLDLLKIDTEGHDLSVLRGATTMLASKRIRLILCEFHTLGNGDPSEVGSLFAIQNFLHPLGYSAMGVYTEYFHRGRGTLLGNAIFVCPATDPAEQLEKPESASAPQSSPL